MTKLSLKEKTRRHNDSWRLQKNIRKCKRVARERGETETQSGVMNGKKPNREEAQDMKVAIIRSPKKISLIQWWRLVANPAEINETLC